MKKVYLIKGKLFLFFLSILIVQNNKFAYAQLVDCNAFIQGKYVEVGVNFNGAYGSSAEAPSGYHPHCINQPNLYNATGCSATTLDRNLGFVADPAKDGWTIGGPMQPEYMGDYFVPGIPFEGWSIKVDGVQANCWNGRADTSYLLAGIPGSNVRHYVSGSRRATEWEGVYDSLLIIQRTILDTANTYFTIRVKIKNLAHRKRTDVYYFRSVDPDNDQTWSLGGYPTDNTITYQNPHPSNLCVVSSWGKGYDTSVTYLGMGTKDARARCFLNKSWPISCSIDSIYNRTTDSTYLYDSLTSRTEDLAIGLVFKIDSLPAFDSTLLKIAYMFGGPDDISGATDDEGLLPEEKPTAIGNFNGNDARIQIAPNPFMNMLNVKGLDEKDQVHLFDLNGIEVKLPWTRNKNEAFLQANGLATGVYIIRVEDANGQLKYKQVLQHKE